MWRQEWGAERSSLERSRGAEGRESGLTIHRGSQEGGGAQHPIGFEILSLVRGSVLPPS